MSFLDELAARRRFGMKPGLETMLNLCAALGDPQLKFKAIHVAGTNGKGAVCAILDAALRNVRLFDCSIVRLTTEASRSNVASSTGFPSRKKRSLILTR